MGPLPFLHARFIAILRWSERYTKTDMVYLATNGSWLGLGQVAIAFMAFVLSVAFAHYVSKDAYGTYRFLLSLFWVLTAFSLTGLPAAVARAVARGQDGAYRSAFPISIFWGAPMALIALGISAYYFYQGNPTLAFGALVIAAIGPFMQSAYLYGSFLEGKKRFKENALFGIILNAVPSLGLLVAMQFTSDVLVFLGTYLLGTAITGLVLGYVTHKLFPDARKERLDRSELLALGGHFSAMNILSTISLQIDRLMVYHYLGAVQLAVYAFATSMPDQVRSVFNNVATLAFPKFVDRPAAEIRQTLGGRLWKMTLVVTLIAIAYVAIAPLAFHILFPAYAESIFYSQVYALTLIAIPNIIPLRLLEAHAAKRELYIFNIVTPLFQIGTLFIGVMTYGILGVVVARVISRLFNLGLGQVLTGLYFKRAIST